MNAIYAAQSALKELAGARLAGDPVKAAINRAALLAKLPYWRAFDIWYGKARRIEQNEQAQLADALEKKRRMAARNELAELRARLSRLETMLSRIDTDFHCETIAALRNSSLRTD